MSTEAILTKIQGNWETFIKLVAKVDEPRRRPVADLLVALENRLVTAPASSRSEYHGAYPGGLVEHNIKVCSLMSRLSQAYETPVPVSSLVLVGLFHNLGKVGDLEKDMYLEQDSQWHRDRGMVYDYNKELQYMSVSHRSLWLLQHFGVSLTQEEFTAIMLSSDGAASVENTKYAMLEPSLAIILQNADRMVCQQTRGRTSVLG